MPKSKEHKEAEAACAQRPSTSNWCRIDIKGIMAHPWYNQPMRPHYEEALAKLAVEQEAVDKKVGTEVGQPGWATQNRAMHSVLASQPLAQSYRTHAATLYCCSPM